MLSCHWSVIQVNLVDRNYTFGCQIGIWWTNHFHLSNKKEYHACLSWTSLQIVKIEYGRFFGASSRDTYFYSGVTLVTVIKGMRTCMRACVRGWVCVSVCKLPFVCGQDIHQSCLLYYLQVFRSALLLRLDWNCPSQGSVPRFSCRTKPWTKKHWTTWEKTSVSWPRKLPQRKKTFSKSSYSWTECPPLNKSLHRKLNYVRFTPVAIILDNRSYHDYFLLLQNQNMYRDEH